MLALVAAKAAAVGSRLADLHHVRRARALHAGDRRGEGVDTGRDEEGAAADLPRHRAGLLEHADGAADGVAGDAELVGEVALRRNAPVLQPLARLDALLQGLGDVVRDETGHGRPALLCDPILAQSGGRFSQRLPAT